MGPAFLQVIDPRAGSVRVLGDLTVAHAQVLCATVERLCGGGHRHVVLDMSDVEQVGSGVLAVLEDLQRRLRVSGVQVRVYFSDTELSVFGD